MISDAFPNDSMKDNKERKKTVFFTRHAILSRGISNSYICTYLDVYSLEYNAEELKKVEILVALFLRISLSPWNWFLL